MSARSTLRSAAAIALLAALASWTGCSGSSATPGTASEAQPTAPPKVPTPEERLRAELDTWKSVPYVDNGKTRSGIGNSGFVSAVFHGAFGLDIPSEYGDEMRTGKLVAREKLAAGDLVFFEGQGFGPFRSHTVGIYIADSQVALATRELGISVVRLNEGKWNSSFKTGRHIPREPNVGAPNFDASKYGANKAALLHDIAKAWDGVLYKQGGTTFDGIGNDEFIRNIYEAIYDTELEGTPAQWVTMGDPVPRDKLEPGDIILYEAVGIGSIFGQRHAGMYIGDGEFVHSVKGSAVTTSKVDDPRWSQAFKMARRVDPLVLTRIQETRVADAQRAAEAARISNAEAEEAKAARTAEAERQKAERAADAERLKNEKAAKPEPPPPASKPARGSKAPPKNAVPTAPSVASENRAPEAPPYVLTDEEKRLRASVQPWLGTPYKWGGTTKAGVDCSAFVQAVYRTTYNVDLPRTADVQENLPAGLKIRREDLEVGDLVFFRTQGMGPFFKSYHVGIYVGNGEFAQSSGSHGVVISRLDNYYWNKKYEGARRLPPHDTTRPAANQRR